MCVLWVLKNAEPALLQRWAADLTLPQLGRVLDLLYLCLAAFEYKVRRLGRGLGHGGQVEDTWWGGAWSDVGWVCRDGLCTSCWGEGVDCFSAVSYQQTAPTVLPLRGVPDRNQGIIRVHVPFSALLVAQW